MTWLDRLVGPERKLKKKRRSYEGHEAEYWDTRFAQQSGELRAPGHSALDEDANARSYASKRAFFHKHLHRWAPLATPTREPPRLLDAGCGPGAMTETWLELGYAVTGVDFAQTAVDAAAAHYGDRARFLLAGLDAVPPGAPYNLVVCIDVLFHVVRDHAWLAALRAMRDAADPAGPVIIQESLDPTQRASRHVRWRSRAEYAAALADLGMRIDEHQVYHLDGEDADKHVLVCRRNDIPTN